MKRFFFTLACLWTTVGLLAEDFSLWTTHFAYSDSKQVVETPNKVFVVSNRYLFSVDKQSGEMETYSKATGLSNNDVQYIAYSGQTRTLLIFYTDAQIDLMDEDGNLYAIPDLANKNLAVDKVVYQVCCDGDYAYVACGFGVMAVNLKKYEIGDTYIVGADASMAPVYGVTMDKQYLYVLTDDCVKRADRKTNMLDSGNWSCFMDLPGVENCRDLCLFGGEFYLCAEKGNVYRYDSESDEWETMIAQTENEPVRMVATADWLNVSMGKEGAYRLGPNSVEQHLERYAKDFVYVDESDMTYLANGDMAVVGVRNNKPDLFFQPQGPYNSTAQSLSCSNGRLWLSPGGSWTDRLGIGASISYYENGRWTSLAASQMNTEAFVDTWSDVVSIAADPADPNHFYFATWGEGIFEVMDGKMVQLHTSLNTDGAIDAVIDGAHYTRVDGLVFDAEGNLWFSNSGFSGGSLNLTRGLGVRLASGQWYSTDYLQNFDLLRQVLVSSRGQKWVVSVRKHPGVFVLDDGGTLMNPADDKTRFFSSFDDQDGNNLAFSFVYAIAEDRSGSIWVGTDLGPIVLHSPQKVFDTGYHANRIKIAREDGSGLADYLLEGQVVRSIAVDGGNRKWIGTETSGVYLLSADGTQTIRHFHKDNSPLSSNQINAIAINGETGEVFFATEDGLLSYHSDATDPEKEFEKSKVKVYPSPVRPDYASDVRIVGLEENSLVKIIDASGHLVFEGRSNGGSISWNLKNRSGQPVSSGAYFVLCTNDSEDNNRSIATKFMVLR